MEMSLNQKVTIKDLASTNESLYLNRLATLDIEPNFWCSLEYFQKAGYQELLTGKFIIIVDPSRMAILPPMSWKHRTIHTYVPGSGIWADLVGFSPIFGEGQGQDPPKRKLLDYQYIYNPADFLSMYGKRWSTFRKNSRKFPKRYGPHRLFLSTSADLNSLETFIIEALDTLSDETIHDVEVMVKYIFNGDNRLFTIDEKTRRILSVSIWDENHQYINYRYCLCVDEPFISEYTRLQFYSFVAKKHKLVNDGGVLDRPSLKLFKDKLNPVKIEKIYTWQ